MHSSGTKSLRYCIKYLCAAIGFIYSSFGTFNYDRPVSICKLASCVSIACDFEYFFSNAEANLESILSLLKIFIQICDLLNEQKANLTNYHKMSWNKINSTLFHISDLMLIAFVNRIDVYAWAHSAHYASTHGRLNDLIQMKT